MSGSAWAVLALLLAGPSPMAALQAPPGPDSVQTRLREQLVGLRDTVRAVSAALVDFQRDLGSAGPETVVSRARRLARACRSTRSAVVDVLPRFSRDQWPVAAGAATDSVRAGLRGLARTLDEHCLAGLGPTGPGERADSLRAWGPYRTAQLRGVIDRFHSTLNRLAAAAGVKLPPPAAR